MPGCMGDARPWPLLEGSRIVFLPLGSWEQHGESMPLYVDTLIACRVAEEAAGRLGAAVLPPLAYGVSGEHRDFPLTVWLSPSTYCSLLTEIFSSLESHGVKLLVAVNGHGGNRAALEACASHWNYSGRALRVLPLWPWEAVRDLMEGEVHAGRLEASVVAYLEGASYRGEGRTCEPLYPLRRTRECSGSGSVYPGAWESDPDLGERAFKAMVEYTVGEARRAAEVLGLRLDG